MGRKARRRRGLGRHLLRTCAERSAKWGVQTITANLSDEQVGLVNLLKSEGFKAARIPSEGRRFGSGPWRTYTKRIPRAGSKT